MLPKIIHCFRCAVNKGSSAEDDGYLLCYTNVFGANESDLCEFVQLAFGRGLGLQLHYRAHMLFLHNVYDRFIGTCVFSADIIDAASMGLVATVSLGGAFVPNGFHAFWIAAERYNDGKQRFDGLQPEPDVLPKIGELDWTGEKSIPKL